MASSSGRRDGVSSIPRVLEVDCQIYTSHAESGRRVAGVWHKPPPSIGQFSINTGTGGAFGVATSSTRRHFAAVNDNTDSAEIWTVTA